MVHGVIAESQMRAKQSPTPARQSPPRSASEGRVPINKRVKKGDSLLVPTASNAAHFFFAEVLYVVDGKVLVKFDCLVAPEDRVQLYPLAHLIRIGASYL